MTTIGIDFQNKCVLVDEKSIKLQIWDTAGQERFKTINRAYFHGSHGVLLVYDVCNMKTFDNVGRWISEISISTETDPKVILVA